MYPSEVRERILSDHGAIRAHLDRIELLAEAFADGADGRTLRGACEDLLEVLLDHIDREDRILAPLLRDADAWGDVRTAELEAHHAHQRQVLRQTVSLITDPETDPLETVERVHALVADLREDMRIEDAHLLDPVLLRDDVVAVDHVGA